MDPIVMPLVVAVLFGVNPAIAGVLPLLVVVRFGVAEV
jgi:hypothetical protein